MMHNDILGKNLYPIGQAKLSFTSVITLIMVSVFRLDKQNSSNYFVFLSEASGYILLSSFVEDQVLHSLDLVGLPSKPLLSGKKE